MTQCLRCQAHRPDRPDPHGITCCVYVTIGETLHERIKRTPDPTYYRALGELAVGLVAERIADRYTGELVEARKRAAEAEQRALEESLRTSWIHEHAGALRRMVDRLLAMVKG